MYLTRMQLDPARPGTRRVLASPRRVHGAVAKAFDGKELIVEDRGRVLWRVDHSRGRLCLYVVSPFEPNLSHVASEAGCPGQPVQTRDYTPLLDRLEKGQVWNFRLAANPVRSVRTDDAQTTTKPTAQLTVAGQTKWLLERQGRLGFEVLRTSQDHELSVHSRRGLWFDKRERRTGKENRVPLYSVTYDGRLRVTDAEALRHALVSGIGKGKAYGCGLMTLASA